MDPIVSIIIPCYNQGIYLSEALDSVIAQTYQDWECVIMDDGSKDESAQVAMKYVQKDDRIKFYRQDNGGVASARNNAIQKSIGKFILPLDADDKIGSQYLEKAMEHFEQYPETKLVYCKSRLFGDENGEWILPDYCYGELLWGNILFCSCIFKRKDYDKTSGYDSELRGLEDWDFWLSLLNEGDIVYRIEDILFYYRRHPDSRNTQIDDSLKELYGKIFRNHIEKYSNEPGGIIYYKALSNELSNELERIHASKAYQLSRLLLKVGNYLIGKNVNKFLARKTRNNSSAVLQIIKKNGKEIK